MRDSAFSPRLFISIVGRWPAFLLLLFLLCLSSPARITSAEPAFLTGPALAVDVSAGHHAISPFIYGLNFPDESLAAELHLPIARWGGNATTRYNWQVDATNHANDWFFEDLPNDNAHPELLPDGSASDLFVEQNKRTGTETLLTIPMIGWTTTSRDRACGFSIAKYGAQQSNDWQWFPDCGNGILTSGQPITTNVPSDTSVAISPAFVASWMQHLKTKYGTATSGGVRFYNLDNEPMLWDDTHRDVHPTPTSYDEMRDRTYQYAPAIKTTDPNAQILGPAEWGWTGYFWSALDWAPGGSWWNNPQDRLAHGDVPFIEWYLQQMKQYEVAHGVRILDYVDEHFYPQANGIFSTSPGDANTQALRLRSTRSFWDPTYTDESWINEPVYMIPRMHDWVNNNYPGTKTAIGEYNWGALGDINGALAEADILGIMGREGLDLATLWDPPTPTQPGAFAFRIYRNYDGAGSMFGETGVQATSADQSQLAIYAAQRSSDQALTLVIVNKTANDLTSSVSLAGLSPALAAQVYRYSTGNLNAIARQSDLPVTSSGFSATFPANSITLVVVPPAPTLPNNSYLPLIVR
ncbi:MAG: glycoside hydrolase family 44 protein [Anaerolineae bacterium]